VKFRMQISNEINMPRADATASTYRPRVWKSISIATRNSALPKRLRYRSVSLLLLYLFAILFFDVLEPQMIHLSSTWMKSAMLTTQVSLMTPWTSHSSYKTATHSNCVKVVWPGLETRRNFPDLSGTHSACLLLSDHSTQLNTSLPNLCLNNGGRSLYDLALTGSQTNIPTQQASRRQFYSIKINSLLLTVWYGNVPFLTEYKFLLNLI
jgi:hypothetical protein